MAKVPTWQDAFRSQSVRVGFGLHLTRAMAEFLSAVADDVEWDRSRFGGAAPSPDNFLATSRSLVKRGLIQMKPRADLDARFSRLMGGEEGLLRYWNQFELTPAGRHVVELLKLAGLFVEADAAIEKKAGRR